MTARLTALCLTAAAAVGHFVLWPAAAPSGPAPTRLVHGPVVFRVTGYQHLDPETTNEASYRYLVIFKLNRDPYTRLNDEDRARGIDSPRGNYSMLDGRINLADVPSPPHEFDGRNCFFSDVSADARPSQLRALNRIPTGMRVKVRLQPLTPSSDGRPRLGKVYVVRATIRKTNVFLRQPNARSALKRIGCGRR